MGKGRLKLRKKPVFVCYCVEVCYCRGSAKVMALSPKAWVHLSSVHMRNCCRGFYFFGEARENSVCRLGGMWWRIGESHSRLGSVNLMVNEQELYNYQKYCVSCTCLNDCALDHCPKHRKMTTHDRNDGSMAGKSSLLSWVVGELVICPVLWLNSRVSLTTLMVNNSRYLLVEIFFIGSISMCSMIGHRPLVMKYPLIVLSMIYQYSSNLMPRQMHPKRKSNLLPYCKTRLHLSHGTG